MRGFRVPRSLPVLERALGKGIARGPPALGTTVVKAAAQILGRKEMSALGLAEPGRAKD